MKYENWLFGKDGALFRASAMGKFDLVSELIAEGANVNASSRNGYTPLHRAAQNGYAPIVKLLLEKGANATTESKDKETPLTLASQNGHTDIITILKKYCINH